MSSVGIMAANNQMEGSLCESQFASVGEDRVSRQLFPAASINSAADTERSSLKGRNIEPLITQGQTPSESSRKGRRLRKLEFVAISGIGKKHANKEIKRLTDKVLKQQEEIAKLKEELAKSDRGSPAKSLSTEY